MSFLQREILIHKWAYVREIQVVLVAKQPTKQTHTPLTKDPKRKLSCYRRD